MWMKKIADRWWTIIADKYSESQRHYHTMDHIEDMLKLCLEYKEKLKDINTVVYAIIFHEYVSILYVSPLRCSYGSVFIVCGI